MNEPELKTVHVSFTASFMVALKVPVNATPSQIGDELSNITIPENDICTYMEDSFEPGTDDNGDPRIYDTTITE